MTGIAHGIEAMNNEIKRLQSINAELVEILEKCEDFLTSFDPRQPSIIPIATRLAKIISKVLLKAKGAI